MKIIKKSIFMFVFSLFILMGTPNLDALAQSYDCAAGKHNYSTVHTEPTRTIDGEIKFSCVLCDHTYRQIIPATEHNWGDWIIDKQPTCTEPGSRHHTCTTTSYTHMEYEDISPLNHDYKKTIKNPTCTETGTIIHTCTHCADTYRKENGSPTGHDYEEKITTPATPKKEGILTFICKLCDNTYNETIPKTTMHEHQYAVKEKWAANCETNGKTIWSCTICNDTFSETINATEHNWGEWITDKRENLTTDGSRHRICKNNNSHTEQEIIPKGITSEVTPTAIAINIGSLVLLIISTVSITSEFSILAWERKERKLRAELLKKGGKNQ